ncbi:Rz-like spanin [Enterobacter phage Tyrion]|uniref:Rz-like spanin n=1 Tax=Enterobacter phage Tyrion TaxID=1864623 RepID=UPI000C6C46AF|nr:Rz-like spanin [Enterobacter phage Tyrion]AUF81281.1 putative 0-spanin [Enterobacter phage Tyrion]
MLRWLSVALLPGISMVTGSMTSGTHRRSQIRNRLMIRPGHNEIRRKHKLNVMRYPVLSLRGLMLILLLPLLGACSQNLTRSSESPNTIPELSPLARQPARSSVCSPTCLKKATELTSQQQKKLSDIGLQVSPVSSSMTH